MSDRGPISKVLRAIAVLLLGPILGFVLGTIALPPDPNFVSNGGHATPGDGFLIIFCVLIGLVVSVAFLMWRHL